MRARHGIWLFLLAALLVFPFDAGAAVGRGASGSGIARMVAHVPAAPGAKLPVPRAMGEAAGWTGGILALEGFRKLGEPLTRALASGLGKFLPGGAAGKLAGLATEFLGGAALKV